MMRSVLLMLLLAAGVSAWAGEGHGHDHGGAPAAATNGPARQPDGSVFLPKLSQRQLSVRTLAVEESMLARTVELAGKVVMDPNAGGKVQPTVAGRLEAGPRGLPSLGQTVRKGEVLAFVTSSAAPLERANQSAQLAEIRAAQALAQRRLARLQELSDTVPRKDVEAAESELASLAARASALGAGLSNREALVAPVSGVIASSQAVAGQVVDARELLYEIVDPARLQVEALVFDNEVAANVAQASLAIGQQRVPLQFIGAARSLREQAMPLTFRARQVSLGNLAVGQPVKVFVQTRATIKGIALPAASLMRDPANQTIVWVKTAPEKFVPRVVTIAPLDGVQVAVITGLKAGDRIATQGATLINQVR